MASTKTTTSRSTRSTTAVKTAVKKTVKPAEGPSKSEIVRKFIRAGHTIRQAEVHMAKIGKPMGYAFIYGVAKRAGLAEVAANRRPNAGSKFAEFARWMGIPEIRAHGLGLAFSRGEEFVAEKVKPARRAAKPVVAQPVAEPTAE